MPNNIENPTVFAQIHEELEKFLNFKRIFSNQANYLELDQYGFALISPTEKDTKPEVDLILFAVTHGDETIGLQIINLILADILTQKLNLKIAFQLNNLGAYLKNIRYVECDLNRSFLISNPTKLEHKRAGQIENILRRITPRLSLDLHQTIEASKSPFSVLPEIPRLIRLSHLIAPEIPIICFSNQGDGFSAQGKTLSEFLVKQGIPGLVFELGEKGFNDKMANTMKNIISKIDVQIALQKTQENPTKSSINYRYLQHIIPNTDEHRLRPGYVSFQEIQTDEILSENPKGNTYKAPEPCIMIFPRYKNIIKEEVELGYLAVKRTLE